MLSQTIATKAIGTVGQFVLLALLAPDDFGLVTISYGLSLLPVLIQQGGVRQVLVQRHHHFRRYASPAFWLSLTQAALASALMILLIPVAQSIYEQPRLTGLMLLVAVLFPLDSLSVVPMAHMQGQLRFRLLAVITFIQNAGQIVGSLVLALLHFGPYSLVGSRVVVLLGVAVMVWVAAPVHIRRRCQVRRWRLLLADGGLVVTVNGSNLAFAHCPNLILGGFTNPTIVGYYSTAYNLSLQAMVFFTESLGQVLLPVLSRLRNDPARQADGFIRAARLMACLGIPACLLQVPLAGPLLHALFADKWNSSIFIIQILSAGMAIKIIGAPANSLLYAQGRFKTEAIFAVISAAAFIGMVTIGAWRGGAAGVAIAAMAHMIITEPLHLHVALGSTGRGWAAVLSTFVPPAIMSCIAIGSGWLLSRLIPAVPARDWWVIGVVGVTSAAIYLPLLRFTLPAVWEEGRVRAMELFGRR
jgi:O-antigen/teichoic acid export membrane protein